jgi:hypothetical protein
MDSIVEDESAKSRSAGSKDEVEETEGSRVDVKMVSGDDFFVQGMRHQQRLLTK